MAKILITPEEMDRIAGQFTSGAQQSQEISNSLTNAINNMQGQWEGMTQQSFFQRYEEDKKKIEQYIEMLKTVGEDLKKIAERFRMADQQS
ncbi:WXG100 family type VII secretion target [Paenibacillus turicensis]|uniref:ESAT-6-like protein n=1 Tax=Paenibacillus turicensis TaxID=160487 RepID=A0ABS4FLE1_9BACL|nr:WXG100 family type VII secretion target [Paenibacillus turicensis]MBP1903397.1 WXG100 family type VII secretion target [Paenibacillus turicensis]